MKPHVTVLLGTTLAAMTVAAGNLPPLGTVLVTLACGASAPLAWWMFLTNFLWTPPQF